MDEKREKVTREETLKRLEELGVQFSDKENNPFGKIENASMMGAFKPIYINVKKGIFYRFKECVKNFFKKK